MKHEAWAPRDWEKDGLAWVVVTRERAEGDGWVEVGAFLVDAWCLGVKESSIEEIPRQELGELLDHYFPEAGREAIEPACARTFIEGAAAYAQSLGFLPHRDFRKTRRILAKIDASACAREFTFGREGRPYFVADPDDDDARINRVLAILTARFGEDGFGYEEPRDEAELDAEAEELAQETLRGFHDFLKSPQTPDPSLTDSAADGYITGAISLHGGLTPLQFVPGLFGGTEPAFPDDETRRRFEAGLVQFSFETSFSFADEAFAPELPPFGSAEHRAAAAEFCRGLRRAFEAHEKGAALIHANPAAAAALAALQKIATPPPTSAEAPAGLRDLAPVIGEHLHAIHLALAPLRMPD